MFTKLKKKIEEENQTELVIGIPPPQLPTPNHSRRASDGGVGTPGLSTCSEASDSDREQKPKEQPQGSNLADNDSSRHKSSPPRRSVSTNADDEEISHKLQVIKREKQELERQLRESVRRVELLAGRCENREDIESFQSQEMAKVKHLLLCSQQELRAADERLRQRSQELQQARDRAVELEKALSKDGEQARARHLERDKAALEAEVDRLKQDSLQNATRISQLECELGSLTDEHDGLKHMHDVYKFKATTMIDEKDRHISDLEDKVRTLEKRLEGTTLTGDEHIQALVEERKQLEKKLDESRQHLSEVKTSWSDKINNLEAQIFNLNQKMAEDSQECSHMEKLLADAQQRLKDQQQQCAKFEEQLLDRDTELANMRCHYEEEFLRQRALQDCQLDELRMQAADLRAQLTQAQRDRDQEAIQAQAHISALETSQTEFVEREIEAEKQVTALENTGRCLKVELNKKVAECKMSQERIQELEASQQTLSEKASKLEKQLSLVLHSETTLKHSLKRSEAELKTMKEELAKLKKLLASAEMENKCLMKELETRQQQADKQQSRLEEEVTQLQKFLQSATEKLCRATRHNIGDPDSEYRHSDRSVEPVEYGFNVHDRRPSDSLLSRRISSAGVQPQKDKVEAVRQFPQPKNLRQLREFLGLVNFYRRFIPKCANILHPLHSLLVASGSKATAIQWNDQSTQAFRMIKEALANATMLTYPQLGVPQCVMVDASDAAIGAVLQQRVSGVWRPISFSRKLSPSERRYSTFGRELLAIYAAIRHFRHYVEGQEFFVLTDHNPLTYALRANSDSGAHVARELRQMPYIAEFTTDIRHVSGTDNAAADALSRGPVNAISLPSGVDFSTLTTAQRSDGESKRLLTA
nr:golgin subfamily A member 1-like [Rhipicephalus microplus]